MKKDLLKIRADLMYAVEQNSKTLLGFAINDLDTFLYKNSEALNIDSVVLPTDKEGTFLPHTKYICGTCKQEMGNPLTGRDCLCKR